MRGDMWWTRMVNEANDSFREVWYSATTKTLCWRAGRIGENAGVHKRAVDGLVSAKEEHFDLMAKFQDKGFRHDCPSDPGGKLTWRMIDLLHRRPDGYADQVRRLLGQGADPNGLHNLSRPLCLAVEGGDPGLVGALVDAGARVDDAHYTLAVAYLPCATPLAIALMRDHTEMAHLLLARGADVPLSFALALEMASAFVQRNDFSAFERIWQPILARLVERGAEDGDPAYQALLRLPRK